MCSFKLKMHEKPFSAGARPRTPIWGARSVITQLPQTLVGWGGGSSLPVSLAIDALGAFGAFLLSPSQNTVFA